MIGETAHDGEARGESEPTRYQVRFVKSQATVAIPEDGIILEHALRAGLQLRYGCQGGSCGACMVRVEGDVFQWGRAIDDQEKEQGFALICSSYPRSDLVIDG